MQTDESRQEVLVAVKLNLATVKTIIFIVREKLIAVVNFTIKWRYEQPESTHYSENSFLLQ